MDRSGRICLATVKIAKARFVYEAKAAFGTESSDPKRAVHTHSSAVTNIYFFTYMPTVYASGNPDSNGYLQGLACTTASSLISQIRDILTQAGCTVDSSQIGATIPTIKVTGIDGGDSCYTIWKVQSVSGNQKKLTIQGDLTGTEAAGNLSTPVEIPFYEGVGAKLYLSTDAAGGVVFINNGDYTSKSAHFGFLERTTPNPTYWMVGMLDPWLDSAQIATDIYNNKWFFMHRYFTSSSESKLTPIGAYQLLWDAMAITMTRDPSNSYTTSTTNNTANITYRPWLGNFDSVTGKPNLGLYGYFIGGATLASYVVANKGESGEKAVALHFPGSVRFARTGLASLATARQFQALSGRKFISGGALGEFQGFAISA